LRALFIRFDDLVVPRGKSDSPREGVFIERQHISVCVQYFTVAFACHPTHLSDALVSEMAMEFVGGAATEGFAANHTS